jgi:hypothetical protein
VTSLPQSWGTQQDERTLAFPCDRLVAAPDEAYFRGISIQAPPRVVYRWLCQMRVAPYSYDWIDNLGRRSPRRWTPGLEELAVGQKVMQIFDLADFTWDQHLTLRIKPGSLVARLFGDTAVTYRILASGTDTCRLLVKYLVRYPRGPWGWLVRRALPWGDWIMMRRQFLTFKALAEGTSDNGEAIDLSHRPGPSELGD